MEIGSNKLVIIHSKFIDEELINALSNPNLNREIMSSIIQNVFTFPHL